MILNSSIVGGIVEKPTLEEIMKSSRVKRCLFGRPDHGELEKQLNASLDSMETEQSQKWNYDFKRDAPIPSEDGSSSSWQWEPVSASRVPNFYRPKTISGSRVSLPASGSSTLPVMTLQEPGSGHGRLSDQNNNSSSLPAPPAPSVVAPSATATDPAVVASTATTAAAATSSRRRTSSSTHTQPQITDYMKIRKSSRSPHAAKRPRRDIKEDDSDSSSSSIEECLQPSC